METSALHYGEDSEPSPRKGRRVAKAPDQRQFMVVEQLCVNHGRVRAVRNADFHLAAGELVALVGPNGAGKSSLLAGIMGWAQVTGSVVLQGQQLINSRPEQIVRRGVSLVPEARRVFGDLTVTENLRLGASALPRQAEVNGAIERELDRFPALARMRDRQASKLSGGEQQQLSIARALVTEPSVLMLDEPSFGLAPVVVEQVLTIVVDLARAGVTVLLVEQNALAALEISDRAYAMQSGELRPLPITEHASMVDALSDTYLGSAT